MQKMISNQLKQKQMAEKANTSIIIGPVRFSYCNVWKPRVNDDGKEKYGCAILFPKDDKATLKKVKAAIQKAIAAGQDKLKGKKNPKQPLHDGDVDREGDAAYANHYYFNANSDTQPGIVDSDREPIIDARQFYSGCYGYVSINFYAYPSTKGQAGIAAGLNNIMKTKDGEPLSGRASAEKDFEDIIIEDEDEDDDDDFESDLF